MHLLSLVHTFLPGFFEMEVEISVYPGWQTQVNPSGVSTHDAFSSQSTLYLKRISHWFDPLLLQSMFQSLLYIMYDVSRLSLTTFIGSSLTESSRFIHSIRRDIRESIVALTSVSFSLQSRETLVLHFTCKLRNSVDNSSLSISLSLPIPSLPPSTSSSLSFPLFVPTKTCPLSLTVLH